MEIQVSGGGLSQATEPLPSKKNLYWYTFAYPRQDAMVMYSVKHVFQRKGRLRRSRNADGDVLRVFSSSTANAEQARMSVKRITSANSEAKERFLIVSFPPE
jgi:hypothetical protein